MDDSECGGKCQKDVASYFKIKNSWRRSGYGTQDHASNLLCDYAGFNNVGKRGGWHCHLRLILFNVICQFNKKEKDHLIMNEETTWYTRYFKSKLIFLNVLIEKSILTQDDHWISIKERTTYLLRNGYFTHSVNIFCKNKCKYFFSIYANECLFA